MDNSIQNTPKKAQQPVTDSSSQKAKETVAREEKERFELALRNKKHPKSNKKEDDVDHDVDSIINLQASLSEAVKKHQDLSDKQKAIGDTVPHPQNAKTSEKTVSSTTDNARSKSHQDTPTALPVSQQPVSNPSIKNPSSVAQAGLPTAEAESYIDKVVNQIRAETNPITQKKEARLFLNQPHLQGTEVKLSLHGQTLQVTFSGQAERIDWLQNQQINLQQRLQRVHQDHSVEMHFTTHEQSASNQQHQGRSQQYEDIIGKWLEDQL